MALIFDHDANKLSAKTGDLVLSGGPGSGVIISGVMTINPATAAPPFTIGTNGQGQLVTGLRAATADVWTTGRTITLSGDTTGVSSAFNGSANLSITTTLAATIAGVKTFSNTTDAGSAITGAVIVSGGLGVAKSIYTGGLLTVNRGSLGTTAGNLLQALQLIGSSSNGDSLRVDLVRVANGTAWDTAEWKLYRNVDVTPQGYINFGQENSDPLSFGKGSTQFALFDANGAFILTNNALRVNRVGASASASLILDADAGQNRIIQFRTGTASRWLILTDNSAEGGSNTGSNLAVNRYDDAGAYLNTPIVINRQTGNLTHYGQLELQPLSVQAPFTIGGNGQGQLVAGLRAATADAWTTGRTITLTGKVTATSAAWTGSGNISIATSIPANAITATEFRTSVGLSVVGRSTNTTGDVADITAASDGQVLRRSGTTIAFGTVATAGITDSAVTLAKIANIATNRFLGRVSASSGVVEELTAANAWSILGTVPNANISGAYDGVTSFTINPSTQTSNNNPTYNWTNIVTGLILKPSNVPTQDNVNGDPNPTHAYRSPTLRLISPYYNDTASRLEQSHVDMWVETSDQSVSSTSSTISSKFNINLVCQAASVTDGSSLQTYRVLTFSTTTNTGNTSATDSGSLSVSAKIIASGGIQVSGSDGFTVFGLSALTGALTVTETATAAGIRITGVGMDDTSLTAANPYFMVGLSTGQNLIMDTNEFQSRNNGVASTLLLNNNGGNITLGAVTSVISAAGRFNITSGNLEINGYRMHAFMLRIVNTGGTIQHRIGRMYDSNVASSMANGIIGATNTLTNTPTGTDSSTNFAAGGKILTGATNVFAFNTIDQDSLDYTWGIATVVARSTAAVSADGLVAFVDFNSRNINGVTRVRPELAFRYNNGSGLSSWAINTTNLPSGASIEVQVLMGIKV